LENLGISSWQSLLAMPNSNWIVIQLALLLNLALVVSVMIWTFVSWAIVSSVSQLIQELLGSWCMLSDLLFVKLLNVTFTFGVMEAPLGKENSLFGRGNAKKNGSWLVPIRKELIVPSGL
jgi:hypothetical protein